MAQREADHSNNSERGRPAGQQPKPPIRMQQRAKYGHDDLMENPHGDGPVNKDVLVKNNGRKTY